MNMILVVLAAFIFAAALPRALGSDEGQFKPATWLIFATLLLVIGGLASQQGIV